MTRQFGRDPEPDSGHNPETDTTSDGETMKPWMQRLLIGLMVATTTGGIASFSMIIIKNLEASSRIEAKLTSMDNTLDSFINVRYQSEQDRIHERLLAAENRIRLE